MKESEIKKHKAYLSQFTTVGGAEKILGVNRSTIGRWVNEGKITAFKETGYALYLKSELESLIE